MKISKTIILISSAVLILGGGLGAYALLKRSPGPAYDFAAVRKSDLTDEVDLTGSVKPAQEVKLAFEKGGKVAAANVKVGDHVKSGQVLITLNSSDLGAQLNQAEASISTAQALLQNYQAAYDMQMAKLADLKNGARPEDLQLSETKVANARQAANDAQTNLNNVQTKAANDLDALYGKSGDILNDAYAKASDAVFNKTAGIFANPMNDNPSLTLDLSRPELADQLTGELPQANRELSEFRSELDSLSTDQAGIDSALSGSLAHLVAARNFLADLDDALNYAVSTAANPPATILAYKTNLNLALNSVNSAISAVNTQQKTIATQKVTNQNQLAAAQTQLDQAENGLELAENELKLKQAGASSEQISAQQAAADQAKASISAQQASVRQAQAIADNYRAQLAKSVIVSPIDGTISQQDAKVGEIVPMNQPVVSIISDAKFQVEAQASEDQIEKIKAGEAAIVTLDADNSQKNFPAKVITVDPGNLTDNGAPAYKVTFEFGQEDASIKDGLTANVKILASEKKNVLAVPLSSIIKRYAENFVLLSDGQGGVKEEKVGTGISQNGLIEITSGLSEGDKIVSFGLNK